MREPGGWKRGVSEEPRRQRLTDGNARTGLRRLETLATVALVGLVLMTAGCAAAQARIDQSKAKEWLGRNAAELYSTMGQPTREIAFPNTGGKMLIYAPPGGPHFVFETDGLGRIDRAAQTKE